MVAAQAFHSCTSLMSVTLPSTLTVIGDNAYRDCFRLVEVINHSALQTTPGKEEKGCVAYYALTVHGEESKLALWEDFYFLRQDGTNYLIAYVGDKTTLTLPDYDLGESYAVHQWAFAYQKQLNELILPDTITGVGAYAFFDCTSLIRVVLPSGLDAIADYMFYGCPSLVELTLPKKPDVIGAFAFGECRSLTEIVLPQTVRSMGRYAFYNCRSLQSMTFRGTVDAWNKAEKGAYWSFCLAATQIVCRDGTSDVSK